MIVGRDEPENERLKSLAREGDALLEVVDIPGPISLLLGRSAVVERLVAAEITLTYGKARHQAKTTVRVELSPWRILEEKSVAPLDAAEAEAMRIGR